MIEKLVVFDLDGTINRTDLFSVPAHLQAIEEFGFPHKTAEQIKQTYGMSADEYMNEIAPGQSWEVMRKYLDRVAALEDVYIKENGKAYDGMPELLEQLRVNGYKTAVCSNASYRYISFVLNELNIMEKIDYIQPLEREKTKVDTLRKLLERVEPKKAVMIGDTKYDIEAGKANNLKTIGCLYGFRAHEMSLADYQVNSPSEIYPIIDQIFGPK